MDIIASYDNRRYTSTMSAATAHSLATPIKVAEPSVKEVEVIAASLGYTLLDMSTSQTKRGYKFWRLFRDGLLTASSLYGGGLNLLDVRNFLEAERYARRFDIVVHSAIEVFWTRELGNHHAVVVDIPECGYAIACQLEVDLDEPDWFYRDNDQFDFADLDGARARMLEALDCDLASVGGRVL